MTRWLWTVGNRGASSLGTIDTSVVVDVPPVRAAVAFVLVVVFGGVLLYRAEAFVVRSVATTMERPALSTVYGVAAHGCALFLGLYLLSQATRIVIAEPVIVVVGAVIAAVLFGLAALGLTVVGLRLTELVGERRPWYGLVVGAALGAGAWLVPSLVVGAVIWTLLVSVGIGGPAREWVHTTRATTAERDV